MSTTDLYRTVRPAGTVLTNTTGQTGPLPVTSNTDPAPQRVIADITDIGGPGASVTFAIQWADQEAYIPTSWGDHGGDGWGAAVPGTAQTSTGTGITVASATPPISAHGTTPRYFRILWTITGTPSVTLTLCCS
jgi:hypothetical protein